LSGGFPSQTFSAAADGDGSVFLGTGPDGQVVKVSAAGDKEVYFRAVEPLVTAVMVLPNGELLAASAPGGKIYKVRKDRSSTVWCETDERYVWALAPAPDGFVLAATGERGRLLRIDRNGKSSVLFDGDESHLVSLAIAEDGAVWAGGSGRGLVYRIDAEGHGLVVYDDELPEARAVVLTAKGEAIVAFDAPPLSEKRPPALRLRVSAASAGAGDAVGELEAREPPTLQGVIEGLTSPEAEEIVSVRGKIVRLSSDGAATELWRSRTEAPFALALDTSKRAVFATGEPAKLWRVDGPDEIALLATLKEAQATSFARSGRAIVIATSNPAATYRMDGEPAASGTYLAPTADAGSVARWGTLRWSSSGSGGRVELFTRTGNCEDPDGTWSAWGPARTDSKGSALGNPDGRYFQWRARITGAKDDGPRIASVNASYATRNRPPSMRDLRIEPATGAVSAKATVRWSAADPDGDGIAVDVQVRRSGTSAWASATRSEPAPPKPSDPTLGNDGSAKEGKAVWDTSSFEEGVYELRAAATDQPANAPGEGLLATSELPIPVFVDRTPPSIDAKRRGDAVEVVAEDALSPVARLELIENGKAAFSPRCDDGVCDDRRETFRIPSSYVESGDGWSLRATDGAGNSFETPVPAR